MKFFTRTGLSIFSLDENILSLCSTKKARFGGFVERGGNHHPPRVEARAVRGGHLERVEKSRRDQDEELRHSEHLRGGGFRHEGQPHRAAARRAGGRQLRRLSRHEADDEDGTRTRTLL